MEDKTSEASAIAIQKTSEAQEAVEASRKAQADASEAKHLDIMIKALKAIFPETGHDEDAQMRIFLPRVPLICKDVETMKASIGDIKDNLKWISRLIIASVLTGFVTVVGTIIISHIK